METHLFLAFFCAWICLSVPLEFCIAADSIRMDQSISDGETLVSSGQSFELGFFSPGSSNYRYLGIWYKNTPKTVVWVANRNNPITDSYGVLTITDNGAFVLLNQTKSVIWSPNLSRVPENPVAQLLETGNLVLRDNSDESSKSYVWQSSDHPSDMMLPGMKLGWNLKTGLQRNLTSWRRADDPSLGDFSYRIDISVLPYLVLSMGSSKKFRFRPSNGISFNGMQVLQNSIFKPVFVNNEDEVYFLYETNSNEVISTLTLKHSGSIHRLVLKKGSSELSEMYSIPNELCDNYGQCGANGICRMMQICECLTGFMPKSQEEWDMLNTSSGCIRRMPLNCQSEEGFVKVSGVKLPDLIDFRVTMDVSLTECEVLCLNNCSCTAYAYSNLNGNSGCLMWSGDLIDIRELPSEADDEDIYIRGHASELGKTLDFLKTYFPEDRDSTSQDLSRFDFSNGSEDTNYELGEATRVWRGEKKEVDFPLFSFPSVSAATSNFSIENKLGEGGFGPVYKGKSQRGFEVAVKRLSKRSGQGYEEFKNEAMLIAKLQHKNLVRLLGCCIELDEKILV